MKTSELLETELAAAAAPNTDRTIRLTIGHALHRRTEIIPSLRFASVSILYE